MTKTVLVTSAAGGIQGSTGRHVSEMLLARGVRVRAFVRQIDQRSDRLKSLGAEIFVGDFLDARSVEQAVRDVSSIYFAYPVQDGLADATAGMAFAARRHGVSRLVNLVMYRSSIDAPTPRMRQNYLAEQVFEWAGVGPLHLRAAVFYETVARLIGASLPARGAIRLPLGNESTILPMISAEDVARIAVGLLTGPERAAGTAYPFLEASTPSRTSSAPSPGSSTGTSIMRKSPTRSGGARFSREAGIRMRSNTSPHCGRRSGRRRFRPGPPGSP
ncbi:NAD(P)H-binding protein [Bradyrhizobium sp. RDM4]|uniref:NAD(P)H-binding protein n=1 Tax=Bradyrhizobium sp. RDM4 TaxID=3378765 RepID=UPI0038FD3936